MAEKSHSNKTPPALNEKISYSNWKKEITIWDKFTSLKPEQKGPAVFFQLDGEARDAIRELGDDLTNPDKGLKDVLSALDKMYLKDSCILAYESYETFESFKRPNSMSINDYVIKFEALFRTAKSHEMDIPDGVLAYRLLNNANLSEDKKQLIKATLKEMKYDEMKEKLKKVFTSNDSPQTSASRGFIKHETENETFHSSDASESFYGSSGYNYRGSGGRGRGRGYTRGAGSRGANSRGFNNYNGNNSRFVNPKLNPLDSDGNVSRCVICDSKCHWADKCPDRTSSNKL